LTTVG